MGKFISSAKRTTTNIREFLKEAGNDGGMKYKAVAGETHVLFFPYATASIPDEAGQVKQVKQIIAISGKVHEWNDSDGRYHACACLKDVLRKADDGTVLNDGECPFCNRVSDGWDIYRHRMELEEQTCTKVGKERESHMESMKQTFLKERKASEARDYLYVLVAQFAVQPSGQLGQIMPVIDENGMPKYELKIMKVSARRAETIETSIANATGESMAGSEIAITYPKTDDLRQVVLQSTISPLAEKARIITKYQGLEESINAAAALVDMDAIENSFREWEGMTTAAAVKVTDELFRRWDEYKTQLAMNPGAQYMEYGLPAAGPALAGTGVGIGAGAPTAAPAGVPAGVPTGFSGEAPAFAVPGGMGLPDANAVFGDVAQPGAVPQPGVAPQATGVQGVPGGDPGVQI